MSCLLKSEIKADENRSLVVLFIMVLSLVDLDGLKVRQVYGAARDLEIWMK